MIWYTTSDARRDAEKQREIREKNNVPSPLCSTFCAYESEGRCAITDDGECDAARKEPDQ